MYRAIAEDLPHFCYRLAVIFATVCRPIGAVLFSFYNEKKRMEKFPKESKGAA